LRQQNAPQEQRGTENAPVVVKVLEPQKTNEELAKEDAERKARATMDQRLINLTSDLALYTKLLFIATALFALMTSGLVIAAFLQARNAKKGIAAAQSSAASAASVLNDLDRPVLYPSVVKSNFSGYPIFNNVEDATDERPEVTLAFKNYGRIPAIITERRLAICFQTEPPNLDSITPSKEPVFNLVVVPDKSVALPATTGDVTYPRGFEKLPLWIFGKIRYRSVLGTGIEREVEFLWAYTPDSPDYAGPSLRGGPDRNRST